MEVPGLAGGLYVAGKGMKARGLGLSGSAKQWDAGRGMCPAALSHPVRLVGWASARRIKRASAWGLFLSLDTPHPHPCT